MLRYYSHYTFIYPNTFLKNHIVETDGQGHILKLFPFENEIAKTEFYSGLLIFIPSATTYQKDDILKIIYGTDTKGYNIDNISPYISYNLYHEEDFVF